MLVVLAAVLPVLSLGEEAVVARYTDPPPPASPKEFHEQDMARTAAEWSARELSPLASTQAEYDVTYYHLVLDIRDFYGEIIYGELTVQARSLADGFDELVLDLCSDLIVDSVLAGGEMLTFDHADDQLTISLGATYNTGAIFEAAVYYHGHPCQNNLFSFDTFDYYTRATFWGPVPSISTLSEPYGAQDWWPCKNTPSDKADSMRISIILGDTLTATSNGVLESTENLPPDSKRFNWFEKHPISTYLVSIAATDYTHWREWYISPLSGDSMPIDHYAYPEREELARESWNVLPAMLAQLAVLYGEYPFFDEKYGHTMFNFGGAMEHQCNTSYGRSLSGGSHYYDYIVVHELGHQYWGDDVTIDDWRDIWLNEGFASYTEALWQEHLGGFEAYREYMLSSYGVNVVDPSGPVYDPDPLFSSNSVYDKGAWILHMLRGILRDDSMFFAILHEYRSRHSYSTAITADFLDAASDVAGFNVTPYLYAYLYLTNRPLFEVAWGSGRVHRIPVTVIHLWQTQTDPDTTFRVVLDLQLEGGLQNSTEKLTHGSRYRRLYLRPGFLPDTLRVDPDDWVLKELTAVPMPLTVLTDQLQAATAWEPHTDSLSAISGSPPYEWSLIEGHMPAGLSLSSDGVLSGIPEEEGTFILSYGVRDMTGNEDSWKTTLTVNPPQLPPPFNLTLHYQGEGLLKLRWRTTVRFDHYNIYRASQEDMSDQELIGSTFYHNYIDTLPPCPAPCDSSTLFNYFYRVHGVFDE